MKAAGKDSQQGKASREIIRLLGRLLGTVIKEQYGQDAHSLKRGQADLDLVEEIRQQSVGEHRHGLADVRLDRRLSQLEPPQVALLIRAFSVFSQLANIADDHLVHVQAGPGPLQQLESHAHVNARSVRAYLSNALLAPVITAHPTEVRRKSILDRESDIGALLMRRERANQQTGESAEIEAQLKREIRTLWQTRMLRPIRIHVNDEIENAIAVFSRTFLSQIPVVKRRLAHLFGSNGDVLPFLKPGSWVGGDRDGNPYVSEQTLEYAIRRQSETVLDYYLEQVNLLGTELSICDEYVSTSAALKALAASAEHTSLQQMDEPYRRALTTIYSRLAATRKILLGRAPVWTPRWEAAPYAVPEAFAADLTVVVESLRQNGDGDLADGRLLNLREAVGAFGFHLAVMDLRQNSDVHERALDELFGDCGVVPSYAGLKEN
jgi:phosphoenolpyruvate carboxylase